MHFQRCGPSTARSHARGCRMLMTDCQWCDSVGTVFRGRCYACGTRFEPLDDHTPARILRLPARAHGGAGPRPHRGLRLDLFNEQLARAAVSSEH